MSSRSLRALKWGDVAPQPETIDEEPTVAIGVTRLLRANPNRVQVLVVNPTANVVSLRWGADPTTSIGVLVPANGGSVRFSYEDDGERIFEELRAIASAASDVFITSDVMPATPRRAPGA